MIETELGSIMDVMKKYISVDTLPRMMITDYIEIIIISMIIYKLMLWVKNTKAWQLFRGIMVIALFIILAAVFQMNTIIWLVSRALNVAITAMVVIFQPELRRALESLGRENVFSRFIRLNNSSYREDSFSDHTINEIIKACFEMGKARTGALIVMAKTSPLDEYERTGITLDSVISSQLLINIFEHNTPLHDGAVIIRDGRIVAATCYLPLSDNMQLSKALGTRHRAGVGISEVTDSLTIIVSEETGDISVAMDGTLKRSVNEAQLRDSLTSLQEKSAEENPAKFRFWKGMGTGGEKP